MPPDAPSRRPLLIALAGLAAASPSIAATPASPRPVPNGALRVQGTTATTAPVNILQHVLTSGVIRAGVWLTAPPWGGFDQEGEPDGSEVALVRLLAQDMGCLLYTSPSPRDGLLSRMPSSA